MAARLFRGRDFSLRRLATVAGESNLKSKLLEEEVHAGGTWVTWKRISLFVAVPAILLCGWNAWEKEKEHAAHGRPEFIKYSHLRTRAKPFPWGDGNHSLFHNSHANALPDGYEGESHDE